MPSSIAAIACGGMGRGLCASAPSISSATTSGGAFSTSA